ncbi:hypothetical protein T440DRAFT_475934 [Plenodomus tracheiphilus IPT5]|uniref:Uncharacterized protein n=1 Tax=Plenodomus tracheiphilus IPT5 TaxID=1408161 RepID=A0A6A7BJA3_9PLEO|nr:hypothetical protein T440DRAFT_475934 [Plenodomus tracheiphilus IPT5]
MVLLSPLHDMRLPGANSCGRRSGRYHTASQSRGLVFTPPSTHRSIAPRYTAAYIFFALLQYITLRSRSITMLQFGSDRYYLATETRISMCHELKHIPTGAYSRKDSAIDPPDRTEILRWQTLFGFTATEAEAQFIENRTFTHHARPETIATWP